MILSNWFEPSCHRLVIIVTFLALLELAAFERLGYSKQNIWADSRIARLLTRTRPVQNWMMLNGGSMNATV